MITQIIFCVPFLVPFLLLILVGSIPLGSNSLTGLASRLYKKSFFLWIVQLVVGVLFRDIFVGQVGVLFTMLIPNIFYLLAFAPFFILPTSHKLDRYNFLNVGSAIVSTMLFWNFTVSPNNWKEGAIAFLFIVPALVIMAFLTSFILFIRSRMKAALFGTLAVVGTLLFVSIVFFKEREEKYNDLGGVNKSHLIKSVVRLVVEKKPEEVTTTSIINSGYIDGIFEIKNGKILNKYGGEIRISQSLGIVSVVYTNIPPGEPCFRMYYVDDPSYYGFRETFVDNVLVSMEDKNSSDVNNLRKKLCFNSDLPREVEFRGQIKDIIEKYHNTDDR